MKYIKKPELDMYEGVVIDDDIVLNYKKDFENGGYLSQKLEKLNLRSVTFEKNDELGYNIRTETNIALKEGDLIVFESEKRGYIKPAEKMYTIQEAINEFENIKDL